MKTLPNNRKLKPRKPMLIWDNIYSQSPGGTHIKRGMMLASFGVRFNRLTTLCGEQIAFKDVTIIKSGKATCKACLEAKNEKAK